MADLQKYIEQLQNFDINDVDWDRIGVWPLPARIFLCVVVFAAIILGCHFLIVKDKNMDLERAKTKESELRRSFERKAFEASNLDRYRKQMEEMSGTLEALVSRLPSGIDVPELLEDIDDKGIEARLNINSITPRQEVVREFYVEVPISISVTGGYHEFGAFVSGLAGMPRIVTLHDFAISRANKATGGLSMNITARTYRYKAQEE